MNCDRIAPFYQWIERAAFGGRLQRHRVAFQNAATHAHRILVVGDGDGRFTESLANAFPDMEIDFVEMSAGMVRQAQGRIRNQRNVRFIQRDLLQLALPRQRYDILFTHFFLDCFATETVHIIIRQLSETSCQEAIWIVSDFRQAHHGWRKLFTRTCLSAMYLFFRYAAGLRTRQLPDYAPAMKRAGFSLCKEHTTMGGLIASEWWQR
jgi:tRNA (cmo5U34)-methyltransferase